MEYFLFKLAVANVAMYFDVQQQYHVVSVSTGWVRAGLCLGLTGKLGRAWVVHVIGVYEYFLRLN